MNFGDSDYGEDYVDSLPKITVTVYAYDNLSRRSSVTFGNGITVTELR